MKNLAIEFDKLRRVSKKKTEFWMARDLMPLLGYESWQNFSKLIEKAKDSISSNGENPDVWLIEVNKPISSGKGRLDKRGDYFLTRRACYLTAMNGDPSKPEIAAAQTYFAEQTRRQELREQAEALLSPQERRAVTRERVSAHIKELNDSAFGAGVKNFAAFTDEGYSKLYGMRKAEIMAKKGIPESDNLLDRAGHKELTINDFKNVQAEGRIRREAKSGAEATQIHGEVSGQVRNFIKEQGGELPEDLPAEPSIRPLLKARAKEKKALESQDKPAIPPNASEPPS